jgi:hypothetical protein
MAARTLTHSRPTRQIRDVDDDSIVATEHRANVMERIIWFAAGIILALLAFRFVLILLGANPSNGFADFIYATSHPFVAPFFNLFNYTYLDDGIGRFETYTLIAMAVYTVLAAGLARAATINRY